MDDAAISKMAPALVGNYPNAYSFVKAVAENLVAEEFARLPVAIVRPSIITASWKDPFPGWIDNCSAGTGIYLAVATGLMRSIPLPEKTFCDIIPVDVVASMMISAAWYSANFRMARKFALVHKVIDLFRPFTMKDWIFSQRSVLRLMHAMTPHDKELFELDLTKLCLNEYFENYMLGIRKHLLKEDPVTIPAARRSLQRLQTKTRLLGVAATVVGVATVLWYANRLFSCYQH